MPSIEFLAHAPGHTVIAEVPGGGPMVDVCDDAGAPVAFSCRSANCGACRVEVIAGAPLLEPPAREELDLLAIVAAPEGQRLACQAVIRGGPGLIQLRWVDDGAVRKERCK